MYESWARCGGLALVSALLTACAAAPDSLHVATASPAPSSPGSIISSPNPAAPATSQPTPAAVAAPSGVQRPDPGLTPGEVFHQATVATICVAGYTTTVRSVTTAQKEAVYGAYGVPYPEPTGTYEFDHLIPLELGGDNANANLWPEPAAPAPGFHQKDQLENSMHALVCSGALALQQAQHEIASDWYAAFQKYVGAPFPASAPRAPIATALPDSAGVPSGATAMCRDGTYSFSATHSGSCSRHGGVAIFYPPT